MCELFAMSSLMPTDVGLSLESLARHGGAEGPHGDGWGVAYYAGRDALLLREAQAASESRWVRQMTDVGPRSDLVMSHIRLATFGGRSLANTQPFQRELAGRSHVFAHNGDLPDLLIRQTTADQGFRPVGETDSERAFCMLMERLGPLWRGAGDGIPALAARFDIVAAFANELMQMGTANFLYADSDSLFVHAHRRTLPGESACLPGLYLLSRDCREALPDLAGSGVALRTSRQQLTLLASVPLTHEKWQPVGRGELLAISHGQVVRRRHCA